MRTSIPPHVICIIALAYALCPLVAQGHNHILRKRGLFGPRPPGAACAFNPCSIPSFCSGGRGCELDEFCRHHCTCNEDSTHESCVDSPGSADPPGTTTPAAVICAFNPCTIPNFCGTGRACELDKQCRYSCVCTDDFTHEMCTTITESPSDSSSRLPDNVPEVTISTTTVSDDSDTIDSSGCPPGFPCENGLCEPVEAGGNLGIRCVCREGWAGLACNKEKLTGCHKTCDEGFKCVFISNVIEVCVAQSPDETDGDIISTDDNSTNVCSSAYRHRNTTEQTCNFGPSCKYGVCVESGDRATSMCECDAGASGDRCTDTCCLSCGGHGECLYTEEMGETCSCHDNYTGADCLLLKYTAEPVSEATWYWWVVGVCAVVLVALLVLLVVAPYLMWRHRVILAMKIVHYFQAYEDDDGRAWDAFVWYSPCDRDEKFVVHTLAPRLESQLGFTLNLHSRDFNPDQDISNNTINAVQRSRRTILIITPKFVTSEWPRFEYHVAQQGMLKCKNRIIPILLDDISGFRSEMAPTLKTILNSVTYLEYPADVPDDKAEEKFWERLQLTLPKKRTFEESSNSPKRAESIEVAVIKSTENDTNGNAHKLTNNKNDTEDVYDTIKESDVDIKVENAKNQQYLDLDTYMAIQNGSPPSC